MYIFSDPLPFLPTKTACPARPLRPSPGTCFAATPAADGGPPAEIEKNASCLALLGPPVERLESG